MTEDGTFHPLIVRVLDGELQPKDLPSELRVEAERAVRLLHPPVEGPVGLSPWFEQRVMAAIRRRPRPRPAASGLLGRLLERRELRLSLRPGVWAGVAALLALFVYVGVQGRASHAGPSVAEAEDSAYVRFMLYAPGAHSVAVAGSFNEWDPTQAPLTLTLTPGVWAGTVVLPPGQHIYAFLVDGNRWLPDPASPTVDDGFGQRNSVVTVAAARGRVL
jgi:Glycogen recognition site of AMP-activated protein kinase